MKRRRTPRPANRRTPDKLKRQQRRGLTRSIGVVLTASPFVVTIDGVNHEGLAKLGSYSPTNGDVVYVLRSGADAAVMGVLD